MKRKTVRFLETTKTAQKSPQHIPPTAQQCFLRTLRCMVKYPLLTAAAPHANCLSVAEPPMCPLVASITEYLLNEIPALLVLYCWTPVRTAQFRSRLMRGSVRDTGTKDRASPTTVRVPSLGTGERRPWRKQGLTLGIVSGGPLGRSTRRTC